MKCVTALLSGMCLAASLVLGVASSGAEGVILRDPCEIEKDSRKWDQSVLKDVSSADILYFYWPCDYDPTDCCP